MANNRMYLFNERTGQRVLIAKYYPSTGWRVFHDNLVNKLNDAFDVADFGHLTAEQREANARSPSPYVPSYNTSIGGMYGEKWVLEYEEE